jgi:hypothetical protein
MGSITMSDRIRRRVRAQIAEPLDRQVLAPIRRLRNAGRVYRPIFVGGASGSGTSFLAVSVGQQFDCAGVIYETNLQVSQDSFLYVPDLEVFDSVAEYQRAMGPEPSWSVDEGRRDLLSLYRSYTSGPSDVVIDKGPDINLLRADFLNRCFPDGRFLLIYRDPVANLEGLRRKWGTFRNDSLDESIRFYREIHERFLDAVESFPERVVAVDYDLLVDRYEDMLTAVGQRLGLSPATQRRRLMTRPNVEGMGIRNVRKNHIGVVRNASREAAARLAPGEADLIRNELDPLHARLRAMPSNV